jgi:hypothetical protein
MKQRERERERGRKKLKKVRQHEHEAKGNEQSSRFRRLYYRAYVFDEEKNMCSAGEV